MTTMYRPHVLRVLRTETRTDGSLVMGPTAIARALAFDIGRDTYWAKTTGSSALNQTMKRVVADGLAKRIGTGRYHITERGLAAEQE